MKTFKTWIYHPDHEPKIIDSDQFEEYEDKGWFDSPARFIKTTDFGIEPDDVMAVQALGESIQGVADSLNAQLNLEDMRPKDLKDYALEHHGMTIKGNREKLLKQVRALNDNSSGHNN